MAQVDTGLGWSLKDTYAMASAGIFGGYHAVVPQSPIVDQPLPHVAGQAELGQLGYVYNQSINTDKTGALTDDDIFVFYYPTGTDSHAFVWVSGASTARYCTGIASGATGIIVYREWTTNTYHSTSGLYYRVSTGSGGVGPQCPQFADLDEGMSYFSIVSKDVYKLNAGYAAACFATWWTPAGVQITSPVLISSDKNAAIISYDGSSVAIQTQESFVYNGKVFYMSYDLSSEGDPTSSFPVVDLSQFGAALGSKVFRLLASESYANIQLTEAPPDPYSEETEDSEEEGGGGEDQEDDPVEEETLPVPSVAGHGFCKIYVPSSQELGQMASYLWSGAFDVDQVIKLFSNPMDSILGLSAVPVSLSGTPEQIYLGGVALTGITMPKYTGRTSVKVDFGTATINERWGSYLDYEPYTEFSIYLPFIGIKPLKADDIMGKTISLMYDIDILSGGCVAYIRPVGGSVLYEWSGQCALQIPVTARNYDNVFQTAMSVVGAVGAAIVAPASAPVLPGAVASAAVQAAATKPRIERSGTVNGITGFLGQLRPYIIRTIPEAYIPADQNKFIGYPAYINVDLASVTGYNEVDSIHLENVTATGAELEEIESILKGGVIF